MATNSSWKLKNQGHLSGLTEFEVMTAIAYDYFAHEELDYVIMEVGMGATRQYQHLPARSDRDHFDWIMLPFLGQIWLPLPVKRQASLIRRNSSGSREIRSRSQPSH